MQWRLVRIVTAATLAITSLAPTGFAGERGLLNTTKSPHARMYMVDLDDVRWDGGFWGERFEVCRTTMMPHMWELFQDNQRSHAWANYEIAAGVGHGRDGKHHGPPFNDGDFLKWFEGLAQIYAVTRDPEIDTLMDEIVAVVGKAQREDGYLHTQTIIPQRKGEAGVQEFADRDHFETYNMGHLMMAACVHYRATGKTTMLDLARKAADYLYNFYKTSSPQLARNAICPSHYMGVVEMYRTTGDPRYLELSKQLIEIRDLVENGTDHNQDRAPFREMDEAVGHAVRANYLYAGVADVVAETGDATLLKTLETIGRDVTSNKLYITGATGALYDGASPDGSKRHASIQLVHQAYGRPYQLPNMAAYNESCATIGYALWNWRMLELTGEAGYADLLEQSLYNGVLPAISLEGKDYFYVNALRKVKDEPYEMRWSRVREPYISSFCCPPNVVRIIAEAHNYVYSLSPETLWIHLYGANELDTEWTDGGRIKARMETDYPWDGAVKLTIQEAPDQPFAIRLRIPGWCAPKGATLEVNGVAVEGPVTPGSYAEAKRAWKAGDTVELSLPMGIDLLEANPMVEETINQVAVRRGPLVYCLESNDLPEGVRIEDVALVNDARHRQFTLKREEVAGSRVVVVEVSAQQIKRETWQPGQLYRPVSASTPEEVRVTLVPYYAWGNRGDTEMMVWLPLR
jgi:hypothetical protein